MIRRRVLLSAAAAAFLLAAPAWAQLEAFRRSAQELVDASRQEDSTRLKSVHEAAGRMARAITEWDRGIRALEAAPGPRGYSQHVELGVVYRARGRVADALREFDAAAALQPTASDIHVLRALTLEAGGQFEDAGNAFLTAWTRDAASPVKAYYVATRQGIGVADRDRAQAMLTGAYGRLAAAGGRSTAAPFVIVDAIQDNLSAAPVIGDEATAKGFALLAAGKYTDGVAALEKAARDSVSAGNSPSSHFIRAQQAEALGRVDEARREYVAASAGTLAGRNVVLIAIARLAQVQGDAAGAIDALKQAVRLAPNDLNVRTELAAALGAAGQPDEAFCELMAALLIDPRQAQVHASIGQLYLDTGHETDAVTAFTRALELAPDRYEFRYSLATAYTRLGKTAEAERQLDAFDRLRREALEKRRRDIANEVDREERSRPR